MKIDEQVPIFHPHRLVDILNTGSGPDVTWGGNHYLFHVRIFFHTQGIFQSKCHFFPRLLHMSTNISDIFRNFYEFGLFICVFALVSQKHNQICLITQKVTKIEPATLG